MVHSHPMANWWREVDGGVEWLHVEAVVGNITFRIQAHDSTAAMRNRFPGICQDTERWVVDAWAKDRFGQITVLSPRPRGADAGEAMSTAVRQLLEGVYQ